MRIDDFLSTVGVVKRRTIAKELASNGMIEVNQRPIKPAYQVKPNDVIQIKGAHGMIVEVLEIPPGSVAKPDRERYYRVLPAAAGR